MGEAQGVTLEIEEAHLANAPLYGCNIDTIKCYDTQVRPIVSEAAKELGARGGALAARGTRWKKYRGRDDYLESAPSKMC